MSLVMGLSAVLQRGNMNNQTVMGIDGGPTDYLDFICSRINLI